MGAFNHSVVLLPRKENLAKNAETLFIFNRIGLATAPRADEIAPAVTRAQTLPSIPYWAVANPWIVYGWIRSFPMFKMYLCISALKKGNWQIKKWIQSTFFVEKKSIIKWPVLYRLTEYNTNRSIREKKVIEFGYQ